MLLGDTWYVRKVMQELSVITCVCLLNIRKKQSHDDAGILFLTVHQYTRMHVLCGQYGIQTSSTRSF